MTLVGSYICSRLVDVDPPETREGVVVKIAPAAAAGARPTFEILAENGEHHQVECGAEIISDEQLWGATWAFVKRTRRQLASGQLFIS